MPGFSARAPNCWTSTPSANMSFTCSTSANSRRKLWFSGQLPSPRETGLLRRLLAATCSRPVFQGASRKTDFARSDLFEKLIHRTEGENKHGLAGKRMKQVMPTDCKGTERTWRPNRPTLQTHRRRDYSRALVLSRGGNTAVALRRSRPRGLVGITSLAGRSGYGRPGIRVA